MGASESIDWLNEKGFQKRPKYGIQYMDDMFSPKAIFREMVRCAVRCKMRGTFPPFLGYGIKDAKMYWNGYKGQKGTSSRIGRSIADVAMIPNDFDRRQ